MSRLATAFVLGYHGCEQATAEKLLGSEREHLRPSARDFDWLGGGAYFWESDPRRALEWASGRQGRRAFRQPYVVGAVIDLRNCLDLTVREDIETLARYFDLFRRWAKITGLELPVNGDPPDTTLDDKLFRYRDCAVINFMHEEIRSAAERARAAGRRPEAEPFDTVRGMFQEGPPAFEGAAFRRRTHTQIAVVNPDCVRGYFRPRPFPG